MKSGSRIFYCPVHLTSLSVEHFSSLPYGNLNNTHLPTLQIGLLESPRQRDVSTAIQISVLLAWLVVLRCCHLANTSTLLWGEKLEPKRGRGYRIATKM